MQVEQQPTTSRVLLVDDDPKVLRVYSRALESAGHLVERASDGTEALEHFRRTPFDVIVSDIGMQTMGGLELLRRVREQDLDVPVILFTGDPDVSSAIKAVEHGALRYLIKPVSIDELASCVAEAKRLRRLARLKREALAYARETGALIGDRAGLEVRFESALRGLWMAFHPIVSWSGRRVAGYEALVRTSEPALPHPGAILDAAERLGRLSDLGRAIRRATARAARDMPAGAELFVNLHPEDLLDPELFSPDSALAPFAPRVVLEVTERESLGRVLDLSDRVDALRRLGFRLAVDDLGAGYAGLTSFIQLKPQVVKLDMTLIRNIHEDSSKQRLVRGMVELCREMDISIVGEGVEIAEERDALVRQGCDLLQGFLFARPARTFWAGPM